LPTTILITSLHDALPISTPFYSELFFTLQNSQGGTAFSFRNEHEGKLFFGRPHNQGRVKNPGDLLFVPRYAASFDLSDSQTLVADRKSTRLNSSHEWISS